jgi:hypothetical protein
MATNLILVVVWFDRDVDYEQSSFATANHSASMKVSQHLAANVIWHAISHVTGKLGSFQTPFVCRVVYYQPSLCVLLLVAAS